MLKPNLPKDVIMMIEKNNTVMAIKTLASHKGISMEEAKTLIDAYEASLIATRQKKLAKIAKKQGITQERRGDNADNDKQNNSLNASVTAHLKDIGNNKPLLPYWLKRSALIVIIMAGVFFVLWRLFG